MENFQFCIGEGANIKEALASLQAGILEQFKGKPWSLQQIFISPELRASLNIAGQPNIVWNAVGMLTEDSQMMQMDGTIAENVRATNAALRELIPGNTDLPVPAKRCEGDTHDWDFEKVLDGNDREVLGVYRCICLKCGMTTVKHGALPSADKENS